MITAVEAREIADVITSVESQKQLSTIDTLVWEAAAQGLLKVDITRIELLPCVIEFLRRTGYSLTTNNDSRGYQICTELSW